MISLLLLSMLAGALYAGVSALGRGHLRRKSALGQAVAFVRWLHRPRWNSTVRSVVAVVVGVVLLVGLFALSMWTGSLLRALRVLLCLGVLLVGAVVIRWLAKQRRRTLDSGRSVHYAEVVRNAVAERERFDLVEKQWETACAAQPSLRWAGMSPKLKRIQQTPTGDIKALIDPGAIGGDVQTVMKLGADVLPGVMRCAEVSVVPAPKPGTAWISFYQSPPLAAPLTAAELPISGPDRVSFGVEQSGEAAAVKYGLSTLATGETGSGKSKLFANMFMDILRDGRPTEAYFIDPKLVEFARFEDKVGQRIGNIRVMGYTTTVAGADAMLKQFVDDMAIRARRMKAMGLDEITEPTEDFPARVVFCDEMNELKAIYKTMDTPMVLAISKGRATLDWVNAAVQVSKVSNLGDVRDQFPLRIVMRTATAENTKAALTKSESETGAYCSSIPRNMPGVGYYVNEDGDTRKFRTANFTKAELRNLADGILPRGTLTAADLRGERTWVYVLRDRKGRVMRVGITNDLDRRWNQYKNLTPKFCGHCERVENWYKVHVWSKTWTPYPSKRAALFAEERLIKQLKPWFNVQHNMDNPLANVNMSKRASLRFRARLKAGEWTEAARGEWALRQVKAGFRKQDRVAFIAQRRDEREQRVVAESQLVA